MPAYLIAQVRVTDPQRFKNYVEAVPEVVSRFGGRYVIRGADYEVLEGTGGNLRLIVIEFPRMEDVRAFYNSPEYQEVKKLREGAAIGEAWAVPGV